MADFDARGAFYRINKHPIPDPKDFVSTLNTQVKKEADSSEGPVALGASLIDNQDIVEISVFPDEIYVQPEPGSKGPLAEILEELKRGGKMRANPISLAQFGIWLEQLVENTPLPNIGNDLAASLTNFLGTEKHLNLEDLRTVLLMMNDLDEIKFTTKYKDKLWYIEVDRGMVTFSRNKPFNHRCFRTSRLDFVQEILECDPKKGLEGLLSLESSDDSLVKRSETQTESIAADM